jgi:hypothetical protein
MAALNAPKAQAIMALLKSSAKIHTLKAEFRKHGLLNVVQGLSTEEPTDVAALARLLGVNKTRFSTYLHMFPWAVTFCPAVKGGAGPQTHILVVAPQKKAAKSKKPAASSADPHHSGSNTQPSAAKSPAAVSVQRPIGTASRPAVDVSSSSVGASLTQERSKPSKPAFGIKALPHKPQHTAASHRVRGEATAQAKAINDYDSEDLFDL